MAAVTVTRLPDGDPTAVGALLGPPVAAAPADHLVDRAELRFAAAAIAIALVVFGGLLVIAGPFYPSFDEQKYLGIADNLWAGRGLTTVFRATFISHAPLWTILLGMPHALVGGTNLAWGQFLDGIAGLTVVLAAAWLGWRVRPVVGAVAAIAMIGMLYLHDQTRTARLDVPAAALELGYLAVGFEAVRRGSARWGAAAGAVFAVGFLVKEVDLPVAPVPFLAAALWGVPWTAILRPAGWATLVATIGTSWWFALYAGLTDRVYRLGAGPWAFIPLGFVIATVIGVGVWSDRIARSHLVRRVAANFEAAVPGRVIGLGRPAVAWLIAFAWAGLLSAVFLRTARLTGTGGLAPAQLALYARTWFGPLAAALGIVFVAAVVAVVAAAVDPRHVRRGPVADLVIASICGLPLVLLVVAVGEPPRNYLAQIAVLAALAAAGVVWLGERLIAIRRPAILVALGVGAGVLGGLVLRELVAVALHLSLPPRLELFVVAGGLAGVALGAVPVLASRLPVERGARLRGAFGASLVGVGLVTASGALAAHALAPRSDSMDPARSAAVATVVPWLRTHVDPSETVAFGSFLGYDMALGLEGRNNAVQLVQRLAVAAPTAPLGIVVQGEAPADDWIAIDVAPRNASQFQAYRASDVRNLLSRSGTTVLVYSTGIDTSAPSIVPALTTDAGFDALQHWAFPVGGSSPPVETFVFRVHPDRIAFDATRISVSSAALTRLTDLLSAHASTAGSAAAALARRVVVTSPDAAADADLMRLRVIAAGS